MSTLCIVMCVWHAYVCVHFCCFPGGRGGSAIAKPNLPPFFELTPGTVFPPKKTFISPPGLSKRRLLRYAPRMVFGHFWGGEVVGWSQQLCIRRMYAFLPTHDRCAPRPPSNLLTAPCTGVGVLMFRFSADFFHEYLPVIVIIRRRRRGRRIISQLIALACGTWYIVVPVGPLPRVLFFGIVGDYPTIFRNHCAPGSRKRARYTRTPTST